MKIGKYIIGLVSGITFGMLFAPKKGKDLRSEILKNKGDDPYETCHSGAKVLGKAFKEAGEEIWDELKGLSDHEQVSAFLELSKEKMRSFLDKAEEKGYDVATVVQDKLEGLSAVAKEKADEVRKKADEVKGKVKKIKAKVSKFKKASPFKKRRVSRAKSASGASKKRASKG